MRGLGDGRRSGRRRGPRTVNVLVAQREAALDAQSSTGTPLGAGFLAFLGDAAAIEEAKRKATANASAKGDVVACSPLGDGFLELIRDPKGLADMLMAAGPAADPGVEAPPWLQRVSASGMALAAAGEHARCAGVLVSPRTNAWWCAQCVALDRALFDASETTDLAREVRETPGVTLFCAAVVAAPETCVGYVLVQVMRSSLESSAIGLSNPSTMLLLFDARRCSFGQGVGGLSIGGNAFAPLEPAALLIVKLGVAPTHRRRGIGRALLAAALGHARAMRASRTFLHVDEDNAPARCAPLIVTRTRDRGRRAM